MQRHVLKFYIKPTEEHPNEQGEYALIKEGILKLFTKESHDKTPENERFSADLSKNYEIIEFEINDNLKTKAFKVILEGSDTYKQKPLDINIITKPCIYKDKNHPQIFRFPKHNQKKANIGLIKAYKKNINVFLSDLTGLNNPNNEIYTIDIEQEIQLKAFIYEEQKYYVKIVKDSTKQTKQNHALQSGNITKKIIADSKKINSESIKWAFKIVNNTYMQGRNEAFPNVGEKQIFKNNAPKLTSIPKGYVELENMRGDCINLKLSDIFDKNLLDITASGETLINKNIIFFAYANNPAYRIYKKNGNNIIEDRITSIELKILQTRFSLEFDGEFLRFFENQREIDKWEARSGIPIENLQEDSKKNQQRFCLPCTDNTSFYYDLHLHKKDSTKPTLEGEYFITTSHNPQYLDFKGISCNFKEDIYKVFQAYQIKENLNIPLKVKYQKRVLILIERFKQTTESTIARMNIFIDGKKIDTNGNIIKDESYNPNALPKENPYAYILERPGPDCIGGDLKLRIPSGRYGVKWHNENSAPTFKKETLNLKNDFVHQNRHILIHDGFSPKNSSGCLLIKKEEAKGKDNNAIDNVLKKETYKKPIFTNHIKNKFKSHLFGVKSDKSINDIMQQIEIRIENRFKHLTHIKTPQKLPSNIIRIETQDESEEFIEIIPPLGIDDSPLLDVSAVFVPAFRAISAALKGAKLAANFSKSLTWQEILEIVDKLPTAKQLGIAKSDRTHFVKSKKELDELWITLTKNAKKIKNDIDSRHKKPIYRRELDDKTQINYRTDSKSGGAAIDMHTPIQKNLRKIHIEKGLR